MGWWANEILAGDDSQDYLDWILSDVIGGVEDRYYLDDPMELVTQAEVTQATPKVLLMISHDHIPLSIHIPGSRESQDLATLVLGKLILYTKAPIEDVDRYEILEAAYREKARSDFFADLDEFIEDFKGRR